MLKGEWENSPNATMAAVFAAVVEELAAGFPLPPPGGFATEVELARYQAGVRVIEELWQEVSSCPS